MKTSKKREHEKRIIKEMIKIYCVKNHHQELCPECLDLYHYASKRIDRCPFMQTKTFCSACKVHCYQKEMRNKIKQVMRFSGRYMLFYHPLMTIHHGLITLKERMKR